MTEQQLTNKIIKNAKQQAAALVAAAESQARAKLADAEKQAGERRTTALADAKARLATRTEQQARANEVTLIKARIDAQQKVLDAAFDRARAQIINAPTAQIKSLVDGWLQQYAHDGDQITVAENWAKIFPNYPTTTAVQNGIIIANQIYCIELTVDELLRELREQIALTVAEQLGVM